MLARVLRLLFGLLFGLDRNPLRRRLDRVQAWLTLALVAAVAIAGPVLAGRVGARVYDRMLASGQPPTTRHPVDAVLLEDAEEAYPLTADYVAPVDPQAVPARWTGPDGTPRTGKIEPNQSAARAGTVVRIHTDRRGNVLDTPGTRQDAANLAVALGLLIWVGVLAVAAVAWFLLRRTCDLRRLASWREQWSTVEPLWSGRR